MVHQYKVGDKVRIKEREGKSIDYPYLFTDTMAQHKGKIVTIKEIRKLHPSYTECKFYNGDNHYYLFEESSYGWHSSMFEPVLEDPESTTSTSLKEGDLIPICEMIGSIRRIWDDDKYYLNFDNLIDTQGHVQEHSNCCKKLRELIPDFEKTANEFDAIQVNSRCFPEFSTISNLIKFVQAINNAYNSKKSITTTKTLNENEIRFQKPKTSCIRGSVPTGRAICGRRYKTAIELGHLSNTTCHC